MSIDATIQLRYLLEDDEKLSAQYTRLTQGEGKVLAMPLWLRHCGL